MSKRGGLGRGLSALIPGAPEAGEAGSGLMEVPVNAVAPNPKQPRTRFDDETIATLAASIGEVGLKQEELADRVGVSRSHIANTIRLLALPLEVQQLLADEKITAGHARAVLSLGDKEAMTSLATRIAAEDLSVRQTEDVVRRFLEVPQATEDKKRVAESITAKPDANLAEVEEILSEQLATRVSIQMGAKRGKVVIEFGSPDDLERIVSDSIGSGPGLAP